MNLSHFTRTAPVFDSIAPASEPAVMTGWREFLLPSALFLQGVLTLSPLLPFFGIRGMALYSIVYIVTAYKLICQNRTLPLSSIYLCAAVWFGSCVTAFYWQDVKIAFLPLFFIGSIMISSIADRRDVNRFITFLTFFLMVVLAFSWAGLFYALLGGQGLGSITNPDGGTNVLYLTTFSNYWKGNFIRPAGIFDEPGTLSFVVCALAALRVIYGRKNSVSVALLLAGTVTFSLTHFAFLVLFLFFMSRRELAFKLGVLLSITAALALAYFLFLKQPVDALVVSRFEFNPETRMFAGDNRSVQLLLALSNLSVSSFLWGLDSTGITDVFAFANDFGIMDVNPLGPLVTSGIFVSFPYYYFMLRLFLKGMRSREHRIYLTVVLLFLARPYVTSFGYSVMAMLFLLSLEKGFLGREENEGVSLTSPLEDLCTN